MLQMLKTSSHPGAMHTRNVSAWFRCLLAVASVKRRSLFTNKQFPSKVHEFSHQSINLIAAWQGSPRHGDACSRKVCGHHSVFRLSLCTCSLNALGSSRSTGKDRGKRRVAPARNCTAASIAKQHMQGFSRWQAVNNSVLRFFCVLRYASQELCQCRRCCMTRLVQSKQVAGCMQQECRHKPQRLPDHNL